MTTKKIAVIGAGLGGMAAAYDLVKSGADVTIFDAAGNVGGLAAGFQGTTLGLDSGKVLSSLVRDRCSYAWFDQRAGSG